MKSVSSRSTLTVIGSDTQCSPPLATQAVQGRAEGVAATGFHRQQRCGWRQRSFHGGRPAAGVEFHLGAEVLALSSRWGLSSRASTCSVPDARSTVHCSAKRPAARSWDSSSSDLDTAGRLMTRRWASADHRYLGPCPGPGACRAYRRGRLPSSRRGAGRSSSKPHISDTWVSVLSPAQLSSVTSRSSRVAKRT